ncbi:DNA-binding response regulator [Camelimonas fluminis]|uniref:LuxR C-terminal-related transcriptional regulator n=1 Tax=Camelimonas fluminis TaxID=1576911 RepID=A0ABV7UCG5_9HYPH|nr:response regulator transcription factor [Camelimonas fluminis]GHE49073.1 DNA-binding response regulator [Camelimonas fluminis]
MGLRTATTDYAIRARWTQSHFSRQAQHFSARANQTQTKEDLTAIIQPERLLQDCILTSLQLQNPLERYAGFCSPEAWRDSPQAAHTGLIAIWLPEDSTVAWTDLSSHLQIARETAPEAPVVIIADLPRIPDVARLLREGASALAPVDTGLRAIARILDFVRDGGTYIPASLIEQAGAAGLLAEATPDVVALFSPKQLAVAKALSRGASNKIIAYELNMCESTVKVHVRAIMKKLQAKNRTEVAYIMQNVR